MSAVDPRVSSLVDALITESESEAELEAAIASARALLLQAKGTADYDALFTQLAQLAVELGRVGNRAAEQALVGTLLGIEEVGEARAPSADALRAVGARTSLTPTTGSRAGGGALLALRAAQNPGSSRRG